MGGGWCDRMTVSGEDAEPVRLECTYHAWAIVTVDEASSVPRDAPPLGNFCAFRLGVTSSVGDDLEDPSWESACRLYAKLKGTGHKVPCFWRTTALTRKTRVA